MVNKFNYRMIIKLSDDHWSCMLSVVRAVLLPWQHGERQCLQQHSLVHFDRRFRELSPLGFGSKNPTRPPNMSSAATRRIGMKGSTVINFPKLRLPRMEPMRPNTDWIPNAVDLQIADESKINKTLPRHDAQNYLYTYNYHCNPVLHTESGVPWDFQPNLKHPLLKLQGESAIHFNYLSTPTVLGPPHWATQFNPRTVVLCETH